MVLCGLKFTVQAHLLVVERDNQVIVAMSDPASTGLIFLSEPRGLSSRKIAGRTRGGGGGDGCGAPAGAWCVGRRVIARPHIRGFILR